MIFEQSTSRANNNSPVNPSELDFQRLKTVIHEELVESLDLSVVGEVDEAMLGEEIRRLGKEICDGLGKRLSEAGHRRMLEELMDEIFGLGPLEILLTDPSITDILINGCSQVYVERRGKLELTDEAREALKKAFEQGYTPKLGIGFVRHPGSKIELLEVSIVGLDPPEE